MLDFFFLHHTFPGIIEKGFYQPPLVLLSYAVASFASYTALSLGQQLAHAQGVWEKRLFHWGGAFAMGAGVWSMHFIGMLSYKMRMVVEYDPLLTLLSMVIAIAVAYGVLNIVARKQITVRQIMVGAVLLGLGICGMHYTGMAAMKMDGDLRYTPGLFALSVVIAVAASAAALWMTFALARNSSRYRYLFQIGAALIMGAAICGMHYTGMASAIFLPYANCRYDPNQNFGMLAMSIGGITTLILGIALAVGIYRKEQIEFQLQSSERRLHAMRGLFAAIVESSDDAIISMTLDGIITSWNAAAEQLYGYSAEEIVGQPVSIVVPEKRRGEEELILRELRAGRSVDHFETVRLAKNGQRVDVSLTISPIRDASGQVIGASKIAHDITERKRFELRLKTLLEETNIAKRTAEEAQGRAELASRAKSEFLANMSHEIRTPLNSIIGTCELLANTRLNQEQGKFVDVVMTSGDMLLSVITNILDFSKIESGAIDVVQVPLTVKALVETVAQVIAEAAKANNNELSVDCPDDLPANLLGDPNYLKQILLNLAGNAVKFCRGGKVTLRAAVLRRGENKVWLRFSVEDSGKGIPADKLGMIFEKFTQLDEFSTKKYAGTGLGLAICKRLIQILGGSIDVKSTVGKGSLFWFDLPFAIGSADHKTVQDKRVATSKRKKITPQFNSRILLVEDYPPNRQMAKTMLEKMGCQVETAQNGEEALERLEQADYDAVLMDCQMPEMDGFQTTAEIRKREKGRHTPIIAMTAHVLSGDRERCMQAGMDGYVSKPIRSDELSQALTRHTVA